MIYYIVEIAENGDETVISSHDDADKATQYLIGCRNTATALGMAFTTYRIDTVPSNEEVRAANALIPPDPNRTKPLPSYLLAARKAGKAKMDHEEGYPYGDSDSIQTVRTKDFTVEELFTERPEGDYIASPCAECGALVIDTGFHNYTAKHVAWHNKLLP